MGLGGVRVVIGGVRVSASYKYYNYSSKYRINKTKKGIFYANYRLIQFKLSAYFTLGLYFVLA